MSPQTEVKKFPGYGIVYADGVKALRVVRTFTQGPSKIVNPDGSVSYTTPTPTIHELYGGGFTYADGKLVNNREHLESIEDVKMRERALDWFDTHGKVIQPEGILNFDPDEKKRPKPDYIMSNEVPPEVLETGQMPQQPTYHRRSEEPNEVADLLRSLSSGISSLVNTVNEQGKQISELSKTVKGQQGDIVELKKYPMTRERVAGLAHKKQGETMKKKWADPEYRQKMQDRIKKAKEEEDEPRGHEVTEKDEGRTEG